MGAVKQRYTDGSADKVACSTILIVEDDPDICGSLAMILRASGYEPITACNGVEALDWLVQSDSHPCLILLDLMMPVMDGWKFRSQQLDDDKLANIPVFLLSGANNLESTVQQLHAVGSLAKPFGAREVLNIVQQHCTPQA